MQHDFVMSKKCYLFHGMTNKVMHYYTLFRIITVERQWIITLQYGAIF